MGALERHRATPATRRGAGRARDAWSGQSATEFALSSLLVLSLIFGTIDLGRLVFMRTMLTNAVREAARQGAIVPNNTDLMAAAATQRSPSLSFTAADLTVTCWDWSTTPVSRSCTPSDSNGVNQLEQIKVCTTRTFDVVATRIVGRSSITVTECQQAIVR